MENIEEAEKLCLRLNGHHINKEKKLKAHIHPLSNMKRFDKEHSHHEVFSNEHTYLLPVTKKHNDTLNEPKVVSEVKVNNETVESQKKPEPEPIKKVEPTKSDIIFKSNSTFSYLSYWYCLNILRPFFLRRSQILRKISIAGLFFLEVLPV